MLKKLFSSQTRVDLLTFFFTNSGQSYFIRELTREVGGQINSIRRELQNLKSIGLLKQKSKDNKKYYSLNPDFEFFAELKSIFQRNGNAYDHLARAIGRLGSVQLVVFAGNFVDAPQGVTDLLVVGDISNQKLQTLLDQKFEEDSENIRYTLLSDYDFRYRLARKDKFILDIVNNPANIIGLNCLPSNIQINF